MRDRMAISIMLFITAYLNLAIAMLCQFFATENCNLPQWDIYLT